jgi:uncharacterized protein YndB with AHSA1/START domain
MMTKINVVAEPGKQEILMTREFNAPRELVFRAFTDPALIPQWWGLSRTTTVVDKMEAKPGGVWRYIERDADGNEWAFHGVYHDVTAPERIIYTFEFEGMPGHVLLETVTLEEQDGKTLVKDLSVFQSVADRDGMLQAGMEGGANESWDQLDALLQKL